MFTIHRDHRNPLLSSNLNIPWMAKAAFNPSPIVHNGVLNLLYRASTSEAFYHDRTLALSTIGIVSADKNGEFNEQNHRQLITPEEEWEQFGCEDPKITKIDDVYYIFYTAISAYPFSSEATKVAVATTRDLKTIDQRHLVTPFNAKSMALFPERINGKLWAMLTVNSSTKTPLLALASFDTPEQMWSQDYWITWYSELHTHTIELRRGATDHIEAGAAPVLTAEGWLLIYSHIQDYDTAEKIYGIEAVLLNKDDPHQIISRTNYPFMIPEENYERFGLLGNVILPTGVLIERDKLDIYYGSTDMTGCRANLKLSALVDCLSADGSVLQHVKRFKNNPILAPILDHPWESNHVLNPTSIELDGNIYIIYRAVGAENTSVMGLAITSDGMIIDERLPEPIYVPRASFELKHGGPSDNSGCEDARIMQLGDRLYITYTAYDSVKAPKVAVSSILTSDFIGRKWQNWTMPEFISPEGIDDKDAAIFPEKFQDHHMILHRIDHYVCADFTKSLDFSKNKITRCIKMFGPRPGMWDAGKVGISGPPFKTRAGWIMFYHGVATDKGYGLGAVLLDLDDPTKLLGRSSQPIMTPIDTWERKGWIDNVIFPCGQIVRNGTVYIYYGGADQAVGVATIELATLIEHLG